LEQVTTSNDQNLNSNFKDKKRSLCRLPNGKAGGKEDGHGRRLAPATFGSLPPAFPCHLLGSRQRTSLPTAGNGRQLRKCWQSAKTPLPTAKCGCRQRACLPTILYLAGGERC